MIAFSGSNPCTVFVAGQGYSDQYYLLLEAGTYKESWHHFAYVKNSATGEIKIYLDGALAASTGARLLQSIRVIFTSLTSRRIYGSSPYHGAIDDFRIYKRALTEQEILTLSKLTYSEKAYDPNPGDGTANVSYKPLLEWLPGIYAASHEHLSGQ